MPDQDPSDVMFDSKFECEARILIVDDEDAILRALKRELRKEPYQIITMNDPFAALDAVRQNRFSLIISDNRMPGMTGIELLEQVKQISPETVRIMLTGYTDLKSAAGAINMGGIQRFLTKPWEKGQLLARIREELEPQRLNLKNQELTGELKIKNKILTNANGELRNLAIRDQMTSLFNHAEFQLNLRHEIKLFGRDQHEFCLAMGDIDNFKQVNDSHGHPVGDTVIKTIAHLLVTSMREEVDTVYRYGGEEFAILLRNTIESDAFQVMTRVLEKIAACKVPIPSGEISVTMSFGVGQYQPGWSNEEFVATVDQALYFAKHAGKNKVKEISVVS